jgi:hypothetical protein
MAGYHALLVDKTNVLLDGAVLSDFVALEAVVLSAADCHLLKLALGDLGALGTHVCLAHDIFFPVLLPAFILSAHLFVLVVFLHELGKGVFLVELAFFSQSRDLLLDLLILANIVIEGFVYSLLLYFFFASDYFGDFSLELLAFLHLLLVDHIELLSCSAGFLFVHGETHLDVTLLFISVSAVQVVASRTLYR